MSSILLPLHLTFVGVWLGCILTEALFERALLGNGRDKELILARLHKRVDVIVEIPAFVIVLFTGALMLDMANLGTLLIIKIALGVLAIITNIYCVWLVFRRASAAETENWQEFERLDYQQHIWGAVVLLAVVAALVVGLYRLVSL